MEFDIPTSKPQKLILEIEIAVMGEASSIPTDSLAVHSNRSQQFPSQPCLRVTIQASLKPIVQKTYADVRLPQLN